MKKFICSLSLVVLLATAAFAQQNLIGEVASVDAAGGKIVIQTDAKASVTVSFNDQTAFRRVMPGQTSLANAETIRITDIKAGDRVLVPGWNAAAAGDAAAVKQIVVMARAVIEQTRSEEQERRRARTTGGRITAIDAGKREITIQARGRESAETITVEVSEKTKILRYAPDSLKLTDAVAGTLADLRVGDQIRVVGDRRPDAARIAAEEVISGSVSRLVGIVSEVNAARGEVTVKKEQTGQTLTVAIGKNTTLRRLTPEVTATLKERFERRARRQQERNSNSADRQREQPRNRERRRERTADGQPNNPNRRRLFEDLPAITIAGLKKGDAVLITGTVNGGNAQQLTAVSIIAGDGDLQQILLRTQEGGRNGGSNMSPGLPGNVSGGNAGGSDDDEPER